MFGARPNSQFDAFTQFHVPLAEFDQVLVSARAIGPKAIMDGMAMSVARNLDFMGVDSRMLAFFMLRDHFGHRREDNRFSRHALLCCE